MDEAHITVEDRTIASMLLLAAGFTDEDEHPAGCSRLLQTCFDDNVWDGEVLTQRRWHVAGVRWIGTAPCVGGIANHKGKTARVVLYYEDEAIAHCALVYRERPNENGTIGGVCALCTHPKVRGHGLGKFTLASAIWFGQLLGYDYLLGWIVSDMADFYQSCGMAVCPAKRRIAYRYNRSIPIGHVWEEATMFSKDW